MQRPNGVDFTRTHFALGQRRYELQKGRLMLFLGSPVLHDECIANGETVNGQSATHQGI
jgi:hypothetical protein